MMGDESANPAPGNSGREPAPDSAPAEDAKVIQVTPERLPEAIRALVRGDQAAANRFLDYAREARIRLDLTWSLLGEDGGIEATVLAAPAAGRTAMLFASRPSSKRRIPAMGALIRTATEQLAEADVALAQALLDPGATEEHRIFEAGGFLKLAQLDYLERPIPRFRSIRAEPLPDDITIESWDPRNRAEMIDLLERSYEETLDCPGLTGLRRTEDILEGHLSAGVFMPEWWSILKVDGKAEGVLLFNRAADGNTIELVYLGMSRSVRGRGLGRLLLTNGLAALDNADGRAVVLAVDRTNAPAVRLYKRFGFRLSVKRVAYVRSIS